MALGKKELTAAVVVGIVVIAAAVHFGIFQQKAQRYSQVSQEYQAAVQTLGNAEFIRDEAAFEEFQNLTSQYESVLTSAVAQLNLEPVDTETSPPQGAIDNWGAETIGLLAELNQRRGGQVRLSFLEANGWNFPQQLPGNPSPAALQDRMSRLIQAYRALRASVQPNAEYTARQAYNQALEQLGISAREVSYFAFPHYAQPQHYFNSQDWINNYLQSAGSRGGGQQLSGGGYDLRNYYNHSGLQRFGIAVPSLKKIWVYALIRQALGDQADPNMLTMFSEALEVGIPLDTQEPLNSVNKQLRGLVDIIDSAQRNQVREIQYVALMRPINLAKATIRQPGQTPPPEEASAAATPAMMMDPMMMDPMMMGMGMGMEMGMGGPGALSNQPTPVPDADAVGTGAGIELWMSADNSGMMQFYYDLSHRTGTYGIDDLYVHQQQNSLLTTATIEIVTDVKSQDGGMGAAPADGAVY